jgi:hypothetical protein
VANKQITQFAAAPGGAQTTDELLLQRGSVYYKATLAILLASIAGTNLSATHSSASVLLVSDTGTDATINAATASLAGVMAAADKAKLDAIEAAATADQTGAEIVALLNTELGGTGWQGSGGAGGATNLSMTRDGSSVNILSDTGADASIPEATASLAGAMGSSDKSKLDGLPVSAISSALFGAANGVATLTAGTTLTLAQVPAEALNFEKYANLAAFPGSGRTDRLYMALDTRVLYHWTGSAYQASTAGVANSDAVPEGSTNLYHTQARVLATALAGLSTASSAAVTASDSVLTAIGKLQAQENLKALASGGTLTNATFAGTTTADGNEVTTASAMGALAIDTTKRFNTKSIAADSNLSFSAQPPTANTWFNALVTNTDSAAHRLTLPSCFNLSTSTTAAHVVVVPAGGKVFLSFQWDGTAYNFYGDGGFLHKFDATAAPTVNEDATKGYGPGSFILDSTNNRAYICESNAVAGALWHDLTSATLANISDMSANARTFNAAADFAAMRTAASIAQRSQTECGFSVFIGTVANKDYKIVVKAPHAGTITEVATISESGTCTLTGKINTTALGGTANAVSSTEQSQAHATANAFAAGDDIVLTASANSTCLGLAATIKYTRTMA